MKKAVSIFMSAMMLISAGTVVRAENNNVINIEDMGVRMEIPEEFSEFQGILTPESSGLVFYDPNVYYMTFNYYAISEDELSALMEKPEDEITQENIDAYIAARTTPCILMAFEGDLETAMNFLELDTIPEDQLELVEVGKTDDLTYYYAALEDEADAISLEAPYQEEYMMIKEKMPAILQEAEFYSPVDPEDGLIGQTVSFETTDLDGNPISSSELFAQNEITMINYWGTWCHNCVDEMAELAEIHTRLQEKGCGIIGILEDSSESDKVELAKEIMEENGTNYPNVMLSDSMDFLEEITSWPTSFFVDKDGKILCTPIAGAAPDLYEKTVDKLLAGDSLGNMTTPTAAANDEGVYRITVKDINGDPVQGVAIQLCDDTSCNMGKTDENGVVSFDMPEGTAYEVHVLKAPEGYEKNTDVYHTLEVYSDLVIVLK